MSRPDATAADFRRILLADTPLIDTRAPIEFNKGALPTSYSLPLMTDAERAKVGTCYKQQGQAAAIALGHELVQGSVKEARVAAWVQFAQQHPEGYLYCWRGGLRSQTCQQWMCAAGCDYPRIDGGYKALRRFLIDEFERICRERPMLILAGPTGVNKTGLLQQVDAAVDLEGLANHLGSSFGRRPEGQPTQLNFENALAVALLKQDAQLLAQGALVLEDESQLIGRCSLPPVLLQRMKSSPVIVLEASLEARIEHTHRNYILNKLSRWQTLQGEAAGFDAFADDLTQSLYRVRKRLGGVRYQALQAQLKAALTAHRQGDADGHRHWIAHLLTDYYDPMYEYQLSQRQPLVCFRGDKAAVLEYMGQSSGLSGCSG